MKVFPSALVPLTGEAAVRYVQGGRAGCPAVARKPPARWESGDADPQLWRRTTIDVSGVVPVGAGDHLQQGPQYCVAQRTLLPNWLLC